MQNAEDKNVYSIPIDYDQEHEHNESDPPRSDQEIDSDSGQAAESGDSQKPAGMSKPVDGYDARTQGRPASRQDIQLDECLHMLKRLKAEFDNYRKRVQKEREEVYDYVRGDVFKTLLPILDDMERLLNSDASEQSLRQGMEMIYKNLLSTLQAHGLESFSDEGSTFDPNVHEAVSVEETGDHMDGKVLDTWLKGYRYKGKLLRPAKVKVGQKK
ncbi:MAG: nucleotide exchange factor GrpE [Calditrichaeota bacterium]|nr:nucleotide exchange factor GrpE [Calditrichota bacterium]